MPFNSTPDFRQLAYKAGQAVSCNLQKHWLKAALLSAAACMAYQKDMDINVQLSNVSSPFAESSALPVAESARPTPVALQLSGQAEKAMNISLIAPKPKAAAPTVEVAKPSAGPRTNVSNLANTYSNLTADNKGARHAEPREVRARKRQKQQAYVKRFAKVAQKEMGKYGIPASITLAQGLLESNVGESKLATRNNNHFGMKCFSRSCTKGHCSNFTDDSHKDFFRIYKSAWESFRAHSLLLKRSDRYQRLFELGRRDYKGWAHGLKKAGYATDKAYAEKLINLIEDLELYQYDR